MQVWVCMHGRQAVRMGMSVCMWLLVCGTGVRMWVSGFVREYGFARVGIEGGCGYVFRSVSVCIWVHVYAWRYRCVGVVQACMDVCWCGDTGAHE